MRQNELLRRNLLKMINNMKKKVKIFNIITLHNHSCNNIKIIINCTVVIVINKGTVFLELKYGMLKIISPYTSEQHFLSLIRFSLNLVLN